MTDQRHLPRWARIYAPSLFLDDVRLDSLERAEWWFAYTEEQLAAHDIDANQALLERRDAAVFALTAWRREGYALSRRDAIDMYRRAAGSAVTKANQAKREAAARRTA